MARGGHGCSLFNDVKAKAKRWNYRLSISANSSRLVSQELFAPVYGGCLESLYYAPTLSYFDRSPSYLFGPMERLNVLERGTLEIARQPRALFRVRLPCQVVEINDITEGASTS